MRADPTSLVLTTNPGLEDLVGEELRDRCAAAAIAVEVEPPPDKPSGRVSGTLDAPLAQALDVVRGMRSIHHVLRPVGTFTLEHCDDRDAGLQEVRDRIASLEIAELRGAASFRASTRRVGTHPFSSEDIARWAGGGVRDRIPGLPVDLEGFAVELRADVRDDQLSVSIQHTRSSLSRRRVGPFRPRVALKAPVGWGMLQLAARGLDGPPATVLDPFCGSGTLLREAAALWPDARLLGSDAFPVPVAGTTDNLAALGLQDRSEVRMGDAARLTEVWPELLESPPDLVVANPPFGRRLGARFDLYKLYHGFLVEAARLVAPGRRLVILATARKRLNRAIRHAHDWHTVHVRVVETGGIWPLLVVLERRG